MQDMKDSPGFVRLLLEPSDRFLLERLASAEGGTSMSALVRKLIREESSRRGFDSPVKVNGNPEADHA